MHKYEVGTILMPSANFATLGTGVITEKIPLDKHGNKGYYIAWTDKVKEYVYFENEIEQMFVVV